VKRVVIVGFDGMDPELASRFMSEGRLPNLAKLRDNGTFRPLRTTFPAISPVAWSTFQTGVNPGKHNIFDFLTPDLHTYRAKLSSVEIRPPEPVPDNESIVRGRTLFGEVGCALCHTPTLRTGRVVHAVLSDKDANLYSDLLLHNMGQGLADDITQGRARGDEFRTAPLWGIGERIFFLHDGRTKDLLEAIQAHASRGDWRYPASEANQVVAQFNRLTELDKQHVLNFLRGL